MLKLALYGKGGIGKSTTCCNLSLALASMGVNVLQIGCDPKADSTLALHPSRPLVPVLTTLRENINARLEDCIFHTEQGIYCLEAGGPIPGQGCAGRGIGLVLEFLKKHKAIEALDLDVVLYDVLGDVVCGGFSLPMRPGNANHVLILTSNARMSLYAAANIATALARAQAHNWAHLAGFLANQATFEESAAIRDLANEFQTQVLAYIPASPLFAEAEAKNLPLLSAAPTSPEASLFCELARTLLERFA